MADFPKPFPPMLLSEVKRPFHKPGWVYEEKYDGYRAVAYKNGSSVRIISRNLKDLTARFEEAVEAVARLRAPTLILDGELAVFNEELVSHLGFLRASRKNEGAVFTPPVFVAFDSDSTYEPGVRTKSWIKVKHKVRVGWPEEGVEYTRG